MSASQGLLKMLNLPPSGRGAATAYSLGMSIEVRLSQADASDIASRLYCLSQLIDPDVESIQPLTDVQFHALSGRPIAKIEMDRQWVAGRLRDHVATIYEQLGMDGPELL